MSPTLTEETILAALVAHGYRFETGVRDRSNAEYKRMHGIRKNIEGMLGRNLELTPPAGDGEDADPRPTGATRDEPAVPTAKGRQSSHSMKSAGLSAMAAQVVSGMPLIEWAAILWIINSDAQAYKRLEHRLLKVAYQAARTQNDWPINVKRDRLPSGHRLASDYVPDLVTLALLELRDPGAFSTHEQRATWFCVPQRSWYRLLRKPYGSLQTKCFTWFGGGCSYISHRLRPR